MTLGDERADASHRTRSFLAAGRMTRMDGAAVFIAAEPHRFGCEGKRL